MAKARFKAGMVALSLVASATAVASAPAMAESIGVVASIAPIHSLVASVMAGVGEPHLIVRGAGSEHSYALRPSDAAALEGADAVFWVGEGLETFLATPIANLSGGAISSEMADVPGVEVLPYRKGGAWARHHHDEDEDHDEERESDGHADHGANDPHLWLDPRNASAMATEIARVLGTADPANAQAYNANAEALAVRLGALESDIAKTLEPVAGRPFIVFHDAYQYFEHRFGLEGAGSVAAEPEQRPGAARIAAIRATIAERRAQCVFAEPQFDRSAVEVLVEATGARVGLLDPLGADIAPGPDHYVALMRRLADAVADCLGG